MSRGQKGCYIFCTDGETADYFQRAAGVIDAKIDAALARPLDAFQPTAERYPGLTLRVLNPAEARPFENCVPIYDMQIAAGGFEMQDPEDCDWVELPDSFRPRDSHFVLQVVGESMNRRIPNGAWCLFLANPGGTRDGKIVIVEHRDIQDPDTGASYTVKRYRSDKVAGDHSWRHERIVLSAESNIPAYSDIVLEGKRMKQLKVVGELVAVL
jgi:SOS-response transcriptional repressor LexA